MNFMAAGQLIRHARQAKSWSQRTLAAKAGIDFTYVSKIESEKLMHAPKSAVLDALAQQLTLDTNVYAKLKQHYGQAQRTDWCPSTVLLPDYAG